MQWSYHLGSTILATTSKFKIAVEIGVFRLIHVALYFCSICNNLVHQTKFVMNILLHPRNNPAEEFFIFTQNPRWPLFHVFAITSIRLIRSRQNLAWTYYFTIGTTLRKNFSFYSKSKMAACGQTFATRYTFSTFCNNFYPVNWIQTKFGMNILLDPRNNPAEEFSIFLKIQDDRSRHYGKLRNHS